MWPLETETTLMAPDNPGAIQKVELLIKTDKPIPSVLPVS
jgi:hypothetical protein